MPVTPEQIKDLMPCTAESIPVGGKFFIKQDNGEFHVATLDEWEIKLIRKNRAHDLERLRWELKELERAGKLWRRINLPWQSFSLDNFRPKK